MSETDNTKSIKDDQIDLLDLFKRIGKAFRKGMNAIGRATLVTIIFLLKKSVWLVLSVLIGLGASLIIRMKAEKIYSSEMTIRSNAVPNSDMITYINRLHTFCMGNDSLAMGAALSLSPDKKRFIKDIQAYWAIDLAKDGIPDRVDYKNNYNVNDTMNVRMTDRFIVRARLTDPKEFSHLSEKIIKYVNQNPLFQQRNLFRLARISELHERLIHDISQLDSLQRVKYFEETRNRIRASGGQMVFLQEQNTQLIYSDIYSLYARKQIYDQDLEIYQDILSLLNDFIVPTTPINGSWMFYGKKIIPTLFILCLLILLFIHNRKKLLEVFRKY